MAPRETENNAYAKFGVTNKEHYGMLWYFLEWSIGQYEKSRSSLFILLQGDNDLLVMQNVQFEFRLVFSHCCLLWGHL